MTATSVLRLQEYRDARERRLGRGVALYSGDREKGFVAHLLKEILLLTGGDRAATVWIDEYGSGVAHVHAVLDLLGDTPRRSFSVDLLNGASEEGVPGIRNVPDLARGGILPFGDAPRSSTVIALGSDGSRAWFVVSDSVRVGRTLSLRDSDRLLFLAGSISSILLHRDLVGSRGTSGLPGSFERRRRDGFSAWPVLQDIEGREGEGDTDRRVTCRFIVVRLVRSLLDEDFGADAETLQLRVSSVAKEIAEFPLDEPEARLWRGILDSVATMRWSELMNALLELSATLEGMGHLHGGRELQRTAYEVATAFGEVSIALRAARLHARSCRRLGDLNESEEWYRTALSIARADGDRGSEALTLDGLANTYRELGNIPHARRAIREGLQLVEGTDDRYSIASFHHSLMAIEKVAENWDGAIVHGWKAFGLYPEARNQSMALFDLAEVFLEGGGLRSAEDAYAVVATSSDSPALRVLSSIGLFYVAALRKDRSRMAELEVDLDRYRTETLPPIYQAQAGFYRGLAFQAVGEIERARFWLDDAATLAGELGLQHLSFRIAQATDLLRRAEREGTMETGGGEPASYEFKGVESDFPSREEDEEILEVVRGLESLRERVLRSA